MKVRPTGRPKAKPAGTLVAGQPARAAGVEEPPPWASPRIRSILAGGPAVGITARLRLVNGLGVSGQVLYRRMENVEESTLAQGRACLERTSRRWLEP